ncbi:ribonuclease III [[Emmonsia] crescens]|uniref:Ribonuclease III n=1 Tax=[Emmonsia] crescens TaxID=73230 RepID=A0A2B7ZPG8_9EURO|nr:ribonuclease III [Emmonsia crescens]
MSTHNTREEKLIAIEQATGYIFANPELCLDALSTEGYTAGGRGHKHLAQLGDAALRLTLVLAGYEKGATRGQIDSTLSIRASNSHLSKLGFGSGLDKWVYRSKGVEISMKMMATTVQAILGAVFLDCKKDTSVFQGVTKALDLSWPENT